MLECPRGAAYDEDVFLYFLRVEKARAERSNRPLRLLFATLEPVAGTPISMPSATAAKLFKGLASSLRETDVIGWYRQHHVAAAILSERGDRATADHGSDAIEKRAGDGIRQWVPARSARSLYVRVMKLGHVDRRLDGF